MKWNKNHKTLDPNTGPQNLEGKVQTKPIIIVSIEKINLVVIAGKYVFKIILSMSLGAYEERGGGE